MDDQMITSCVHMSLAEDEIRSLLGSSDERPVVRKMIDTRIEQCDETRWARKQPPLRLL